ncbi:homeobox-leucine zipper protein ANTHOCYANINLESS 2-like isoform X2 [Tripterygium wilfordii]|uniref:homeobox-leucine zipper protein ANTHOCYANINLESS 2-like isoform X2 n=1 Tax=Tripterygium wilfordii TaxID=458696 RepID=UPI0018F846D7|nr:homeobox-leucine zipper protein ANTHOCYANINLESS 2-like isoform X2 [Tripterygium wilfordii]
MQTLVKVPSTQSKLSSPALYHSVKRNMNNNGEMGLIGGTFDEAFFGRDGDDGFDGASEEDREAEEPPKKKSFFKEYPHPDEKQRSELSRRLGLESRQIKFWFQNRRTQMKMQMERHENVMLKQENEKLQIENNNLRVMDPICKNCGRVALPGEVCFDEQNQLKIENARLREELRRLSSLTSKFFVKPLTPSDNPLSTSSNLELVVGRNEFCDLGNVGTTMPMSMGLGLGDGISSTSPVVPLVKPELSLSKTEMQVDRSMLVNLALVAMDELIKLAQPDSSLGVKRLNGENDMLNHLAYKRTFRPCIGMKPTGFVSEATRETDVVIIDSLALVETLMDDNRWVEMFPSIIARATTVDVISTGLNGTKNGALQVMHAEFQVLSPLVPIRPIKFLRFCKQHAEGVWAVVDVSIDAGCEGSNPNTCRRLPSGCLVRDVGNGCSKVTFVEHSEYDENYVHRLFQPYVNSGMAFGARRLLVSLQRQCESLTVLVSSNISAKDQSGITPSGKKNMIRLAQRMIDDFCNAICASSVRKWDKLHAGDVGEDVRVLTRRSMNDPGEPAGVLLSAAICVWLPVARDKLFDFLRDEQLRSEWDILSHGGPMHEMLQIAKSRNGRNCVHLLRASAIDVDVTGKSMLILQETWHDNSGSMVVYAPVELPSVAEVMNGGDPGYVALLPSGFAILPGFPSGHGGSHNHNGMLGNGDISYGEDAVGSFLTVGFQILVNKIPTAKLTLESVQTVNTLISCTIQKIKTALQLA